MIKEGIAVNIKQRLCVSIIFLFFCGSCNLWKEPFFVRISIESSNFKGPVVCVFLEGQDGNAVTGSLVTVKSPGNESQLLAYNYSSGCFKSNPGTLQSGFWDVSVSSALSTHPVHYKIEHQIVNTIVVVSDLMDALGNSMSQGTLLDSSTDIVVSWPIVENAAAYRILISKGTSILYEASSRTNSFVIPKNTLPASSQLNISICAIWCKGDPLFVNDNFSSASIAEGAPCHVPTK